MSSAALGGFLQGLSGGLESGIRIADLLDRRKMRRLEADERKRTRALTERQQINSLIRSSERDFLKHVKMGRYNDAARVWNEYHPNEQIVGLEPSADGTSLLVQFEGESSPRHLPLDVLESALTGKTTTTKRNKVPAAEATAADLATIRTALEPYYDLTPYDPKTGEGYVTKEDLLAAAGLARSGVPMQDIASSLNLPVKRTLAKETAKEAAKDILRYPFPLTAWGIAKNVPALIRSYKAYRESPELPSESVAIPMPSMYQVPVTGDAAIPIIAVPKSTVRAKQKR